MGVHNSFCDPLVVFRGPCGDMIKLLWYDGDGQHLFAQRLERGRFSWPHAQSVGAASGACCAT